MEIRIITFSRIGHITASINKRKDDPMDAPNLTLTDLSKTYGKTRALRNFTYTFTPGIYGLLGPNGAG